MMKLKSIQNKLGAAFIMAMAGSSQADTLTINFQGIESQSGKIYLVMHSNEKDYSQDAKPAHAAIIDVTGQQTVATIKDVKPGSYAIKSFVDDNDNGQMDTNLVGMPKEQYGFSNNAGRFGPAPYEDAEFSVSGDTTIDIKMR